MRKIGLIGGMSWFSTRSYYERINKLPEAEQHYRKAVALEPAKGAPNNNLGVFLCHTGKVAEANQYFQKAVADPFYQTPDVALTNAGVCQLRANDVAEAVETSFAGTTVGRIFDRAAAFDLVVKFDPRSQSDFDRLADLPIDTPNGGALPIRLLADVRRETGPNMVLRENVQRRIVISANVAGRDLGGVVDDMRAAIAQAVPMPAGYRVEYGGQFESEQSATRRLLVLGRGRR